MCGLDTRTARCVAFGDLLSFPEPHSPSVRLLSPLPGAGHCARRWLCPGEPGGHDRCFPGASVMACLYFFVFGKTDISSSDVMRIQ